MTNDNQNGPSLLYTLQGGGRLEPGSRLLRIGLDKHNPLQALHHLKENDTALSVALHEITHFHSLDNLAGAAVLTLLGSLSNNTSDYIVSPEASRDKEDTTQIRMYLYFRQQFVHMLEAWRPLLEGLAVYVQTCMPCTHRDELVLPLSDLVYSEAVLSALNSQTDSNLYDYNPSTAMLSAGYGAMARGPILLVDGKPLGAALELNRSLDWLPYFLGVAYLRALHDRLKQKASEFECPEIFVNWIIRLLATSASHLMGQDSRWDLPGPIDRLYSWIELV